MTDDKPPTTDAPDAAAEAPPPAAGKGGPADDEPDELSLKELVGHLYDAANHVRPEGPAGTDLLIDTGDQAVVAAVLKYLVLHARATEGALRKLAEMLDQLRAVK